MDLGLRLLKESSESWFNSYSVKRSVLMLSHTTFRDCGVHILFDNLSRNGCMHASSADRFTTERVVEL